ncbi:hypothetical protein ACLFMI_05350 [Pseudonocardia nantongensis]|uniref:hypothetical protein n=1 Tax=Pseudonocardia nantongensis TaxID=1181885 RepID=UPI00397B7C02
MVAEREADTGPLPVSAVAAAAPAATPRAGRHATRDGRDAPGDLSAPADEGPDPAILARTGPAATARTGSTAGTGTVTAATGAGLTAAAAALRRPASPYPGAAPETEPAPHAPDAADAPPASAAVPAATDRVAGSHGGDPGPGAQDPGGPDFGGQDLDAHHSGGSDSGAQDPGGHDPGGPDSGAYDSSGSYFGGPDSGGTDSGGTDLDGPGADEPHGATPAPGGPGLDPAAGTQVAAGRTGPTDGDTVPVVPEPEGQRAAPLPPWSVERTVPPAQDLPTGDPVGERAADGAGTASVGASDTGTSNPGTPDTGAPDTGTPDTGTPDAGASDTGVPDAGAPGAATADVTGAPESVSRAVQQALAARAVRRARMRHPDPDDPSGGEQQELPLSVVPSRPSAPVAAADARDRLLSVLITDPARAVDATIRLDDTRNSIEELGDVLRRRRAELAGAVHHLRDCGLDPAQIGRLSGMAVADVRTILDGEDAR